MRPVEALVRVLVPVTLTPHYEMGLMSVIGEILQQQINSAEDGSLTIRIAHESISNQISSRNPIVQTGWNPQTSSQNQSVLKTKCSSLYLIKYCGFEQKLAYLTTKVEAIV